MSHIKNLIHEVHRRSLWQVLSIYAAGSWVVLGGVDVLAGVLGLPDWADSFAFFLLIVGLPIVLATAFVQEGMTTREIEPEPQSLADIGEIPPGPPPNASGPRRFLTWRRAILGGMGAFALLGILTAGYLFMRTAGIGPAATLVAQGVLDVRDPILVAEFQSSSGDSILARTVTEAFRTDLVQSPVVTVVQPAQAAAVLQRMERDPTTRLDPDVAREVALREGMKAIVTGEVNSAGAGFLLTAHVVSVSDGSTLVSRSETARDLDAVIDAMGALSQSVRERLGESLRSVNGSPRLSAVTTGSLEALQKYEEGVRAIEQDRDRDRAIALLEEAVAIDPGFAYAWRKLGTELGNAFRPRSQWVDALTRAYEGRDRLTDYERYRTVAMYYTRVTDEPDEAITAYENAIRECPTCMGSRNNLALVYNSVQDFERAEELLREEAALDTTSSLHYRNLVSNLVRQSKLTEADSVWEVTRRRFPDQPQLESIALRTVRNDWEGAEAVLLESIRPGEERLYLRAAMATLRGRLDEAEAILVRDLAEREARNQNGHGRARFLADLDIFLRGDPQRGLQSIERHLRSHPVEELDVLDRPYLSLARRYLEAGQAGRARDLIAAYEAEVLPELGQTAPDELLRSRADIAQAEGRHDEAIALILQAEGGRCTGRCYQLARAYDLAGQRDSAIAVYDRSANQLGLAAWWTSDRFELAPTYERLGQLYDEIGDLENSAKYYAMFVDLWVGADPVLQPRVEAAQTRIEEIVAERG
jgi:tetratricopeptide (TPR) repeat protein